MVISPFYNKPITSVIIGNNVTSIDDNIFYNCSRLISVTIGDNVTSIGSNAFYNCSSLASLTIPNGVTSIGYSAFHNCSNLTLLTIPNGVASISNSIFYGCTGKLIINSDIPSTTSSSDGFFYNSKFSSIVIGDSVSTIGNYTFKGCSSLASITIGKGVSSIGNCAFDGCSGLKEVIFADGDSILLLGYNNYGYSYMGEGLFYDCPIETIYLGRDLSYNTSYETGYSPFYNKSSLLSLNIGDCVTNIPDKAFYSCENLLSVIISNKVKNIGIEAFYSCDNLHDVVIGNTVSTIGDNAFSYCSSLDTIVIPKGVTSIGSFSYCSNLTSIVIPESVTSIGSFSGCSSLTSIVIPEGVTSIGSFSYCSSLTSIVIPEGVTSISSFSGCSSLDSIVIPKSVTSIGSFSGCSRLSSIFIPEGVTSITESAFSNCSNLTSITIPSSVTSIGNYAFKGCNNLKDLVLENGDEVLSLGYNYYSDYYLNGLFEDCQLETLYLGRNLKYPIGYSSDRSSPFYSQSKLMSVTIGNKVTSIGNCTFNACRALKRIEIEDGESILSLGYNYYNSGNLGSAIFSGSELEFVYIGRDLSYNTSESYGYSPFYGNSKLMSVTIGNEVTSIGANAFRDCGSLQSINIPNNVLSVKGNAFSGCSSLTSVSLGEQITTIASSTFSGCASLESIVIPNSVISIGNSAFSGCGLTSIVIPNNVTSIGDYSFSGCTGLSSLTIGDGVTSIGSSAFYECNGLTSLVIPDGVSSIGGYAFYGCSDLESAIIGNGVTSIGSSAFSGCVALKNLTIGSSVSSIESSAFAGCNEIESIYALNTKAITCDESIFATDAYNNATLYVPEGREQAYAKATPWSKFYIKTMVTPTESFDVKIGSAGYATLYLDYAVERPRGVEAYYISRVSGDVAVLKAVWDYIPANTGVILRGAKGTYTFTSTDEDVEVISDNLLRGTVVDKDIRAQKNTTYYALGRVDGVVGLYRAELEDGYFFNNANKAYLALTSETEEDDDSGQLARSLILRFPNGSTTTITEVMGGDENEEVIYDMQGRRLKEITEPGVYIINGRKVWR